MAWRQSAHAMNGRRRPFRGGVAAAVRIFYTPFNEPALCSVFFLEAQYLPAQPFDIDKY
jgi:hypothetical protein